MIDFNSIAKKWQKKWEQDKVFHVEVDERKKYYIAIVYPYMSGLLHLGHLFTYTTSEALARYKRMRDFNTLVKFGFHCTGTPIIAAAQRVKEKEPSQLETMRKMGITEIEKFSDPEYWCEYFPKETLKDLKAMGFAIDERYTFKTTYLNPPYDKFIRWQFNKLKEKELVKKGKHPVVWCPKDNVPVGDHDRSEGEGETPQEFLLFKHKLDDKKFILSATLRQDTVLGITNLFLHPDIEYAEAKVNDETWILGEPAAKRLKEQGFEIEIRGKVKGIDLIGKETEEFDGHKVMILPATFLDAEFGTGLVHSVPSESADDLIALRDLQKDEETCKKYNLDIEEVKKIQPIPVLNTPGYGEMAAPVMLEKYKVKNQNEREKLDEIKKELYKLSHYQATLNHLYKDTFSVNLEGKGVEESKEIIKKELIDKNYAVAYYELSGKVVCRCLTECIVKLVSDQWFIEYNDSEWKKKAHECLNAMKIYPKSTRKQFEYVIDWLNHWACTREFGLGTKLPWDKNWVIESLSDSTLQMAYCTIAKYLENCKDYGFSVDKLNDEFFDFIYLGKGEVEDIEKSTDIPKNMIETMKKDFEYWYPFDFRNSAKDLVQNHLTFCIFNHTALFPSKFWPKTFLVNGRIMVNNEKMSKSKGNFFTMRELYEKHSADVVRLGATYAGEGGDDANYEMGFLETAKKRLNEIYDFIKDNYNKGSEEVKGIDNWFESKIHETIQKATNNFENMLFKSVVQNCLMDMQRFLKWYLKRTNKPNKRLIRLFADTQIRMLTPFVPHFCEECWELIKGEGYVSNAAWPEADSSLINPKLDDIEEYLRNVLRDIREVMKLAKIENPQATTLFVSTEWKYELFSKVNSLMETQNSGDILKEVMASNLKQYGKEITKFLPKMINARKIPVVNLSHEKELAALQDNVEFISNEIGCKIEIVKAEESKEQKAKNANPGKPAILIK